jgi:hypothetical protein
MVSWKGLVDVASQPLPETCPLQIRAAFLRLSAHVSSKSISVFLLFAFFFFSGFHFINAVTYSPQSRRERGDKEF